MTISENHTNGIKKILLIIPAVSSNGNIFVVKYAHNLQRSTNMEIYLADNIKKLRKEHSLTQEQLAEALGVTVGAVYKWESKQSMPEIKLLVEIADFFETSVDTLLGYSWQNDNVTSVVENIYNYIKSKDFDNGIRYAEKVLKKFPNSFEVVYHSAELYFLATTLDITKAQRTIELFQDTIRLVDQNKQNRISAETIENRIALCYSKTGKLDKAIEILKKNNAEGQNEFRMGLVLSDVDGKAEEALEHLSSALGLCWGHLYNICIGYANAYTQKGECQKLKMFVKWVYHAGQGLRDTNKVSYLDRGDIRLLTILAAVAKRENDSKAAKEYLRQAIVIAMRFDAAPSYDVAEIYFYHGSGTSIFAYDDMGDTAMDIVLNFMKDDAPGKDLMPIWEELHNEIE